MLDVKAIRMEDFIEVLSSIIGRVVTNQTGFQGMFDAHLEFAPDDTTFAGAAGSVPASGGSTGGRDVPPLN
jgi:uncharacterized protein (TIGR03435 family)